MGLGEGHDHNRPRVRLDHTRGSQVCRSFLLFSFFVYTGLRSPEALSGGEPAELTMQQPGRYKGRDEHSGGLHYEH